MPILRCPTCYYATTVRKDSIQGVKCSSCNENLFAFYFEGKSEEDSKKFIDEMNKFLKKKKDKSVREKRERFQSQPNKKVSWIETQKNDIAALFSKEGIIAIVILFSIYASIQYFHMRWNIQKTAIEILTDNGYPGFKSSGINLPVGAVINGAATAKIFLEDQTGNLEITEWQVTSKGIPLLSVFTGSEYYLEINGIELMKLRGN